METNCDELADLADRVEKQAINETEPEPLIELGEEIEYRRENVANLAKMLKENSPRSSRKERRGPSTSLQRWPRKGSVR
jgi:hypothetical protein